MSGRYPYEPPPDRDRDQPPPRPEVLAPWLQERLFDRRIVMLTGPLTPGVVTDAAAALTTLAAMGHEPIQLHVTASDGDLAAAFAVVDAIESIPAPVDIVVPSLLGGAALAVLPAARRRFAYQHARLHLAEPRITMPAGTAERIAAAAGDYLRELEELIVRLAELAGTARSRIEDDLSNGRFLTATQAQEYGLIDEIVPVKPKGVGG